MAAIPSRLADIQQYVAEMARQRGFDDETVAQKFMLLGEEVGELARAARKSAGIKVANDTAKAELGSEAADVLFVLLNICNKLDVDLEAAFKTKEAKNSQRTWQ